MSFALLMLGALIVEGIFGWPKSLFRIIRHPVVWIGAAISFVEMQLNTAERSPRCRRFLGSATTLIIVAGTSAAAFSITALLPKNAWGYLALTLIASSLIATRSLYSHILAVAVALTAGDTSGARAAVAKIVGRDPQTLDSPAIARASIESLAENASDGVVAPIFWGALLGLPGIAAYKAINTLDSMIGHHGERYGDFGWASARLDDFANYLPARLTALLIILATGSREALACVLADARMHRSPNAGWPESALAGALGIRVSGPRMYSGEDSSEPWLNACCSDPSSVDIRRGLRIYLGVVSLLGIILALYAALESEVLW